MKCNGEPYMTTEWGYKGTGTGHLLIISHLQGVNENPIMNRDGITTRPRESAEWPNTSFTKPKARPSLLLRKDFAVLRSRTWRSSPIFSYNALECVIFILRYLYCMCEGTFLVVSIRWMRFREFAIHVQILALHVCFFLG